MVGGVYPRTSAVGQVGEEVVVDWDEEIAKQTGNFGKAPAIAGLGDPSPKRITSSGTVIFTIRFAGEF